MHFLDLSLERISHFSVNIYYFSRHPIAVHSDGYEVIKTSFLIFGIEHLLFKNLL
jgi:hypothetical protein